MHPATRIRLTISVMSVDLRYPPGDVRSRIKSVLIQLAVVMPVTPPPARDRQILSPESGPTTARLRPSGPLGSHPCSAA